MMHRSATVLPEEASPVQGERRYLVKLQPPSSRPAFGRRDLLRWLYLGRLALATGILTGAVAVWGTERAELTVVVTVLFACSVVATALSFWHTHVRNAEPADGFVYMQVLFDAFLVTGVVHVTGGGGSVFAPLYILVISVGALLLPLVGGIVMGLAASGLYFADAVVGHGQALSGTVLLQMGLFAAVALVTGWVGDRLRRAGIALGTVESQLRQLRLNTSDILANISTGVMTVDGAGRVVYLNPAGEALLGLEGRRWEGLPLLDTVEPMAPGLASVVRWSVEERRPMARFKATAHREGQELTLGISTTVLDPDGGLPPSVTAIFQDITLQERLKDLDRRNDRLRAVAELSASLAHEIKNPLASIRSAVEQIAGPGLDRDDRRILKRLVVTESDRLSRLLSEFIDFSGLKMENREEVDLCGVVRDSVALVRQHPEAPEGVRIRTAGVEGARTIPGDADLLHRAVFNLLLNAVQFSAPHGEVAVGVEDATATPGPAAGLVPCPVRLTVSDTGPGIHPGAVTRIFDPFYTTRKGGSGLGLAVVHRAVEAHRGAVFVERADGGGAEFVIYLPGVEAPAPAREALEEAV